MDVGLILSMETFCRLPISVYGDCVVVKVYDAVGTLVRRLKRFLDSINADPNESIFPQLRQNCGRRFVMMDSLCELLEIDLAHVFI